MAVKGPTAQYEVLRTFVTRYGETVYSGVQGDVKPLPVEVAEWIERDSPGRLRRVPEKVERPGRGRASRGGQDRMVREAKEDR